MDQDEMTATRVQQLLEENLQLTQETNEMVREMRRLGRIMFWIKLVLWAFVIILPFLLIGPILEAMFPVTAEGAGPGLNLFGFPSQETLERALDSYQGQ